MRNIHFPFNIVSDTPLEVALEMVKELEISDWDPLEIAAMIENEISLLVPSWRARDSSLRHHSFGHEDDDDNDGGGRTRPFSSASSSHDSPVAVRDNNNGFSNYLIRGNDGGSGSSNSWLNSSTYHYSPATDDDDQSQQQRRRLRLQKMRSLVDTRTQVLHRSLMELINKRRGGGFNTNVDELQHQPSTDFLRRS